jgi:cytochrome c peroxidase
LVKSILVLLASLLASSQTIAGEPTLPLGFPKPLQHLAVNDALVELGRHLFYDVRLSTNGTTSCATCHSHALAFTDGKTKSIGATGALTEHNAMSLVNLAYRGSFGWRDQHNALQQLDRPLFADDPMEMGMNPEVMPESILDEPYYQSAFEQIFSGTNRISWPNIKQALVAFELTLVSGNSEYDAWVFEDKPPSEAAIAGMDLFQSERLNCSQCHGGMGFNDEFFIEETEPRTDFQDNGLEPGTPFRTATLRNIEVTAPYMHDGRFETLEQVIGFYAEGPNPENNLKGFELTALETQQLLLFLNSLTDQTFLANPAFGNPWQRLKPI